MTFYTILLLIVGIALVVFGSDYLVDGASAIARRSGLSEFIIGLTIVGIGTSTPEMVVSFISAIRGSADMSVGNIVGSNIFNTCLILGLTAVIRPMKITRQNLRLDMPLNLIVTILLVVLGAVCINGQAHTLDRIDGAIMLICFALYLYFSFKAENGESDAEPEGDVKEYSNMLIPVLMVVGGLVALIIGGHLFVDSATVIARHFGWSDKLIGITILAGGTSLPELATCVVAAIKKKGQLALGNIIGSNISNILLILGGSSLLRPLQMDQINGTDFFVLLLSALMLPLLTFYDKKLGRWGGYLLLLLEAGYMYTLFV